jgi:hypothetical protein
MTERHFSLEKIRLDKSARNPMMIIAIGKWTIIGCKWAVLNIAISISNKIIEKNQVVEKLSEIFQSSAGRKHCIIGLSLFINIEKSGMFFCNFTTRIQGFPSLRYNSFIVNYYSPTRIHRNG